MIKFNIIAREFSTELGQTIFTQFKEESLLVKGIDGIPKPPQAFVIEIDNKIIATIVIHIFWGQLHIKYLVVDKQYRNQGLGTLLMNHALDFGKNNQCQFAYLETLDFQAPNFYEKLGFKTELIREGFSQNTTYFYMKKFI